LLLSVARKKLGVATKSVSDEEDVVIEAFQSFLRRCRQGNYSNVNDRDDLGRLLVAITIHKTTNQVRDQMRQKRIGRTDRHPIESLVLHDFAGFDQIPDNEPPPELIPEMADSLHMLLSGFIDGELRSIVLYKLEGCSNREVARKIGRSVVTVQRRLRLIRDKWQEELGK
jgi:RNA polymerase sigma factor (sigma-70 family)